MLSYNTTAIPNIKHLLRLKLLIYTICFISVAYFKELPMNKNLKIYFYFYWLNYYFSWSVTCITSYINRINQWANQTPRNPLSL